MCGLVPNTLSGHVHGNLIYLGSEETMQLAFGSGLPCYHSLVRDATLKPLSSFPLPPPFSLMLQILVF
jgi:hypothetical protein